MAQMPVGGESREGNEAPANPRDGNETPPFSGKALLEELGRFAWHAAHQPLQPEDKPPAPKRVSGWQAAVLVVIVLDVVLLYSDFQEWFENPLLLLVLKVLPWLLGATAFAYYSDKVRDWILEQCRRKWLAVIAVLAVLIALPLSIVRLSVFSVLVGVGSDSVNVVPANADDKLVVAKPDRRLFRVSLPNVLKPYRITIKDENTHLDSVTFSSDIAQLQALKSTLAQIPLIGNLLSQANLQMNPLYRVHTTSSKSAGAVEIQGHFEEGFLQQAILNELICSRATLAQPVGSAIHCPVDQGADAFRLPPGTYDFTFSLLAGCDKKFTEHEFAVPRTDSKSTVTKTDNKPPDPNAVWDSDNNEFNLDNLCPE